MWSADRALGLKLQEVVPGPAKLADQHFLPSRHNCPLGADQAKLSVIIAAQAGR